MPLAPGPGTWRQPDSPHTRPARLVALSTLPLGLASWPPVSRVRPSAPSRCTGPGRDTRVREGAGVTQPGTGASGFALRIRSCGSGLPGDFAGQLTGRPTE